MTKEQKAKNAIEKVKNIIEGTKAAADNLKTNGAPADAILTAVIANCNTILEVLNEDV